MNMKQVKNLLQYLGYYEGIPDGESDDQTRDAVFAFQVAYGTIGVDGIPGPEVEKALRDAVAFGMPVYEAAEEPDSDDFWASIRYFEREEFRCKCGGKYCDGFPVEPDETLVRKLVEFRERLGVPVTIGGIRCPKHNANQKGASPNSQHLYGLAADCHSSKSPEEMLRVAEEVLQGTGGLGIYNWGIHFDTRAGKSRWDSR